MVIGVSGHSPFVSRLFYITDRLIITHYLVNTGAEVSSSSKRYCHPQDGLALHAAHNSTIATRAGFRLLRALGNWPSWAPSLAGGGGGGGPSLR